ncbi:class I SAM-dependent methyltransferase [Halococcus thailandensis]|uniref:Type 11 methyltransferase n=1 Tax=Halococcus thailandensis JCM 13552 TaxID=1227457 RepID=M0N8B3_9EURY|nr:methyltransferase domain-containing protein [Halococcus thailandensis]EMA54096.1 type 11 methyltransferase [Halococcus thailandensis JCM 13552]
MSDGRASGEGGDGTSEAQDFYGRWARLYDIIATLPGIGSWRERAVESLALSPGDTVVEMGCGTGANLPYLREAVGPSGTVVGIDFTHGMLGRARRHVATAGWTNVHLVRGDATAPPIERADAVLASFVVGMLGDPAAVVEDWLALVRSGGRVALLDATRSTRTSAKPLDAAFRFFVAASAPPTRKLRYPTPPWKPLDERVTAARQPLEEHTEEYDSTEFALGFVRLASGRVP